MRIYTKEYYTLMMSLGVAELYEPVIDKDYTDEEIEELYQKALDKHIEEERADYDEPPEFDFDEDDDPEYIEMLREELEEYENREPFDEEEAKEEFREMYEDNLEEPDEDLPDWVREAVDPRILAMYFMPEKIYRKLSEQDETNEKKFEELDERVDEAWDDMMEALPEEYEELMDTLEGLEDAYVISFDKTGDEIELKIDGWDDEGEDAVFTLRFDESEVLEDEGVEAHSTVDEDGDMESDCELLYSEMYMEDGKIEVHMMFENNGLKYLTFRCAEAYAYMAANE
ncbi:MAG: DUF4085 family protein [Mogibacterium sp.]|nr:DUF4085 family protein [Mogibacterium sp.]